MSRHRALRVLAAAAAVAVGAAACTDGGTISSPTTGPVTTGSPAQAGDVTGVPGPTVAIALVTPESIAAHHAVSPGALDVAALLHTGLTRRGPNGLAVPAIATGWSTLDHRTWTFDLDSSFRFNDGTPITAQSFVDSWQALADQETRARNAYLGLVAGISGWGPVLAGEEGRLIGATAVDAATLEVQLDEPFPWFPELVAHPAFAPVAPAELDAATVGAPPAVPIGSGPFRVAGTWEPGQVMRLERVRGGSAPGQAAVLEIHFTSGSEEAAALLGTGTVDVAVIGDATAPPGTVVTDVPTDSLLYLGFPVTRAPTDTPEVRTALVRVVDFEALRAAAHPGSLATDTYAPSHAAGASLLTCTVCIHDPGAARELLTANEVEPPENTLSLHVVAGSPGEPWAEAIAASWTVELGWPVAVVRHDLPGLVGFLQSGVPDGPFLLEWSSEYPAAESWIEPLFDRAGIDDFTRFSDRTITRSLEELASLPSSSPNRTTPLKDIRAVLAERVPTIPLAVVTRRVAASDAIDLSSLSHGAHLGLDGLVWRP